MARFSSRPMCYVLAILLFLLVVASTVVARTRQPKHNIYIIDLRRRNKQRTHHTNPQDVLAVQTCVGLFNRNESIAGAAYTVWHQNDLDWLREIESIDQPQFTAVHDFLKTCLLTVAQRRYIHYNMHTQKVLVPNLITLAAVLDAVPLIRTKETLALINETKATMVFDAEQEFAGFTPYDATLYMFQHHAHQTTTMSKLDPGYNFSKSHTEPPLSSPPQLKLADYIVKERLFNFFLLQGCIRYTQENKLMEMMTQPNNNNTKQWPQPIPVFGYDDVSFFAGADPFEAETLCVKGRNLGQVATAKATDLSFWSRKASLSEPLQQNKSPSMVYQGNTTYVALVMGDGDNISMMKRRNYSWVQTRLRHCRNNSTSSSKAANNNNCFPISWTVSPHTRYVAPDILKWYFEQAQVTGQDYFLLPPSGYLYAYPSMMQDNDQAAFVHKTEEAAWLLNSSGSVDWEIVSTWRNAISHYIPRFAERNIVRGLFAVNVPFNAPLWAFGRHEYYKIIRTTAGDGGGSVVLFRPREWRGTSGRGHIFPFSRGANLKPKDMAAEINIYPSGTVCYIYLTSDGGANLTSVYQMVPYLDDHVQIVSHEIAIDMALQRSNLQNRAEYSYIPIESLRRTSTMG